MIYIVLPCYNEEQVLPQSHTRLLGLCDDLAQKGEELCLLYVDDGSQDATWRLIFESSASDPLRTQGIRLAHNVGHQLAIWAGMEYALERGAEAVVTIDADLQDDLQVIPRMVAHLREGKDIVYGIRAARKSDTVFKRFSAQVFYRLMKRLGCHTIYNHADFRLLNARALRALLSYPERNLFLRGIVPSLGFSSVCEYYDRLSRQAGETKYPLSKMLHLAADGITSFSVKPLRWIFFMGVLFILISFLVIVWALVEYAHGRTIQGWTSLLVSVWCVGGCLLSAIGVMGEYVGKIYGEVKRRPRYFIMDETSSHTVISSMKP